MISAARAAFHRDLIRDTLLIDDAGIASNADKSQASSRAIALGLAEALGAPAGVKLPGQTAGKNFEKAVASFLSASFPKLQSLRPGAWQIWELAQSAKKGIADTDQFSHLKAIARACEDHPELKVTLGADYLITPDLLITRLPETDEVINRGQFLVDDRTARLTPLRSLNSSLPIAHASISCKWTMRSDRAQNSRSEALNLIRNRKGHLPHVVVVTGEPTPTRISSLALGTGDIDCVYHFALPELQRVISERADPTAVELLDMLVSGRRLRDIADLPLDLAV